MPRLPAVFSRRGALALGAVAVLGAAGRSAFAAAEHEPDLPESHAGDELLLELNEPFLGDWPAIRERGLLRVLTTYNRTNFMIDHGRGRGLEYEAMALFEQHAARRDAAGGPAPIRVVFIPVSRAALIPALLEGRGDVIAAGMTVTEERSPLVAFTRPYIRDVDSVIVRHKAAAPVAAPEDLSGRRLVLTRGSSYVPDAHALSARLVAAGRAPILIEEASEHLETEDLLEMVNAGLLPYGAADAHLARVWDRLFDSIVVEETAALSRHSDIAWAVRPDATALKAVLDAFIEQRLERERATMATLFRRYYEGTGFLRNPLDIVDQMRTRQLVPAFQRESERVGFNWLMMLAQGFQESRLDPRARSQVGAVGVMQLMPATAQEVGVRDLLDAADNIRGGVTYMDRLRSRYFSDRAIEEADRIWFALAAYNAGPNRINRLRAEAAKHGLDPNRWFGHVEHVVQRRVGSEPVRYVASIRAYFLTYGAVAHTLLERLDERDAARQAAPGEGITR